MRLSPLMRKTDLLVRMPLLFLAYLLMDEQHKNSIEVDCGIPDILPPSKG
jgi:hypothetical protein